MARPAMTAPGEERGQAVPELARLSDPISSVGWGARVLQQGRSGVQGGDGIQDEIKAIGMARHIIRISYDCGVIGTEVPRRFEPGEGRWGGGESGRAACFSWAFRSVMSKVSGRNAAHARAGALSAKVREKRRSPALLHRRDSF